MSERASRSPRLPCRKRATSCQRLFVLLRADVWGLRGPTCSGISWAGNKVQDYTLSTAPASASTSWAGGARLAALYFLLAYLTCAPLACSRLRARRLDTRRPREVTKAHRNPRSSAGSEQQTPQRVCGGWDRWRCGWCS